ncbi:helix-turn-helix domain-containing protein [Actinosynnema sp. NPDC004786]
MSRGSSPPTLTYADRPEDFASPTMRMLDLGAVRVVSVTAPPMRNVRTHRLIRQSDPEQCNLLLITDGRCWFDHAGKRVQGVPGDLVVYDTSHPYEARIEADVAQASVCAGLQVQFPRTLLPHPAMLDRLLGARLPPQDGIRSMLTSVLLNLAKPSATYLQTDLPRLAVITVDLAVALLAHETDTTGHVEPEARQRVLLSRLLDFVERHLGDPGLSPATLASAHFISTRYLHKLFQADGKSVADWIRARRLDRCRRDLADPRHDARPVHDIAARWGFGDGAHFNRLFRRAYGLPPGQFRRMVRSSPAIIGGRDR